MRIEEGGISELEVGGCEGRMMRRGILEPEFWIGDCAVGDMDECGLVFL